MAGMTQAAVDVADPDHRLTIKRLKKDRLEVIRAIADFERLLARQQNRSRENSSRRLDSLHVVARGKRNRGTASADSRPSACKLYRVI